MKQCIDNDKVDKRLKRIEGQVRGLQRMVHEDVPCKDILIQISAVKTALHKTGQIILEGHLQHCIRDSINSGEEEQAFKEVSQIIEQFSRLG